MAKKIFNGVDDINLTAMISECNMAGNPKEWWIDTVRPEKFQFLEKGQIRNFDYKIVISVKNPEFIL